MARSNSSTSRKVTHTQHNRKPRGRKPQTPPITESISTPPILTPIPEENASQNEWLNEPRHTGETKPTTPTKKLPMKTAELLEKARRGELQIVGQEGKDSKVSWLQFRSGDRIVGWTWHETLLPFIRETTVEGKLHSFVAVSA